jgi:hypothetical protein
MRTVAQLKRMIDDNNHRLTSIGLALTKREIKNLTKRNEVLRELMMYLQTKPKEEFILSEKKRLKRIIVAKQSQFYNWKTLLYGTDACAMSPTKQSRLFCKETGITPLRKQLKNLNFLLNENQEQPAVR